MQLLVRILREPLLQFLLIGAAIFALYSLTAREEPQPRDRIVVTEGRVLQLVEVFGRTWQRPPTAQELHGLINAYVKEEIYYGEAVKLGLDRDDTLIRRRMQQKMEFLTEPSEADLRATDADLQAFLSANRLAFRVEARIAFQQIFIKPDGSTRAAQILSEIRSAAPEADLRRFGDATLLPREIPLSPLGIVERNFGKEFGAKLLTLPKDEWSGPIESPFGLHLVRVGDVRPGYDPPLEEIRKEVERAWQTQERAAFAQREYQRLRDKYEVVLPFKETPK